jgi:hypothetical protein
LLFKDIKSEMVRALKQVGIENQSAIWDEAQLLKDEFKLVMMSIS